MPPARGSIDQTLKRRMSAAASNVRPEFDRLLVDIAEYSCRDEIIDSEAFGAARWCLMDAMGCAFQALGTPDCTKLIGPTVAGTVVPCGARVPGTQFELDPVKAAFDITCLIRWLDFNDSWASGGHPSDNIGAILALADHVSRKHVARGRQPLVMREVLAAMIKAYEIHGMLASGNRVDRPDIGLDSTLLVKVASTAIATRLLGGDAEAVRNALSNAFVDGHSLNLYRKDQHAGSRKSWAAADAASRGVWLALLAGRGEMGYPSALTAKIWGFQDVLYHGSFAAPARYGTHVVRNIQFKIAYPAQRHAQSAAECAARLHPAVRDRVSEIDKIIITTHELARRMISVSGPLPNFAARDHCIEYIVAVALLHGNITTASYEDEFAADPRIDALRSKMNVTADPRYTRAYNDPRRRANPGAVQVIFRDGSRTERIALEYPLGDPRRRKEGMPLLRIKFERNLALRFPPHRQRAIAALFADLRRLENMPVHEFMEALIP